MARVKGIIYSFSCSATYTLIRDGMSYPALTPAAVHHRTLAGAHFPSNRGLEAELAMVAGYIPR